MASHPRSSIRSGGPVIDRAVRTGPRLLLMRGARRPRPDALLGAGTVSARLLGHPLLLLGGPRALLLQVAHPAVAAGVRQHSDFSADPFGRLVRTLGAMEAVAFGSPARSARTLRSLEARHRRVQGTTPAGRAYSALDPDLTLWVHATLVDTALAVDRRYLGLLSPEERRRFYEESRLMAAAFRIPEDLVPADLDSFAGYMADMVGRVEVGPDARAIAAQVLRPPLAASWGPAGAVVGALSGPVIRGVTADLLPGRLRSAYGLRRAQPALPAWAVPVPAAALAEGVAGAGMDLASALSRLVLPRLPGR